MGSKKQSVTAPTKEAEENEAETSEMLLVQSKVKAHIKAAGFNCAGDFMEALNKKVGALLLTAGESCTEDGRKTLRPSDLPPIMPI